MNLFVNTRDYHWIKRFSFHLKEKVALARLSFIPCQKTFPLGAICRLKNISSKLQVYSYHKTNIDETASCK